MLLSSAITGAPVALLQVEIFFWRYSFIHNFHSTFLSLPYILTCLHPSIYPSIHSSMHACMHACMHEYALIHPSFPPFKDVSALCTHIQRGIQIGFLECGALHALRQSARPSERVRAREKCNGSIVMTVNGGGLPLVSRRHAIDFVI